MLDSGKVFEWIDRALEQSAAENIMAFCFNLYDDGDKMWSMELVGTGCFDAGDDDWACEEITDFGTRDNPLVWESSQPWEEIQAEVLSTVKEYLEHGENRQILKSRCGVGVGFVDGALEIIYVRQ